MLQRHIELEIMGVTKTHGMGLTVWSPLGQGLLTGKYNNGIPEGSRGSRSETIQKRLTDENLEKLKKLGDLAKSLEITTSQLALAWILRKKEITSAIIGASKPEHVVENVKASDIMLSNDTLEQIKEILNNEPEWPVTYKPNKYYLDKMR